MAAKPSKSKPKPKPEVTEQPKIEQKIEVVRLKGFVDRVAAKSPVKRKELREVVDVTLAELGAALAKGEALNLPGLGNIRVARVAENGVMILRLRQIETLPAAAGGTSGDAAKENSEKAGEGDTETLAEAGEAG